MTLRDLLVDILGVIGYNIDELESLMLQRDLVGGSLETDKSATALCVPLQNSSYSSNIVSESHNTVTLLFDNLVLNKINCKVGIYISSESGTVDFDARILGYYTLLPDGRVVPVSNWELYSALNE